MESIIELMQIFLPNLCFSICYWNLNYNIMKVKEMLDRINCDWVMLENQRELMIMQKYAKIGRLCTLFFQLLALTGKKGKILSNCIYIIGSIFMTYVGCYSGQRVIDHNTNITRKIYQVSFYKLSIKTQKALLLLTMKVMNPCHFSMMGTMVTSHKLFLNNEAQYKIDCYHLSNNKEE
ncbi:hypothetical protein HZH66_006113 [Vespula vulgaris]|uniref:Uncharacterized protein n=1 Tax=Vespula vulgaris TaxID=7454 RepID=A0A834K5P1_VESVU|nr:hypothetical protein HZH66_006113 [Vespula vulgaris]